MPEDIGILLHSICRALDALKRWAAAPSRHIDERAVFTEIELSEVREAIADIAALFVNQGIADPVPTVHAFSHLSTYPLGEWGVKEFQADQWADIVLVDPISRELTEDAHSLLVLGSNTDDATERKFFDTLSKSLNRLPLDWQPKSYTSLRSFVVRNPLPSQLNLDTFRRSNAQYRPDNLLQEVYINAEDAVHIRMTPGQCRRCGALADLASGRAVCANRACRMEGAAQADELSGDDLNTRRAARSWVMDYWIAPGFHETQLYEALARRECSLYPDRDAADIGIDGLAIGIDVKTYASPYLLGKRLQHSGLGRLARYARRIIAIPDVFVERRPSYRHILEEAAGPIWCSSGLEMCKAK